jgi:glycosyltransferase involved in cell wall biosynthesis
VTTSADIPHSKLAVVIPAYNAGATLPACLAALTQSRRRSDEIILFDDGSGDDTAEIARSYGAKVISGERPAKGPAAGRNLGAAAAAGSIIVFVDADVEVGPEALGKLEAPIAAGQAVATFGSYDDSPKSRRIAALYANLRHHWVHQHGRTEAFTFWSGLGAIRADVFRAHGGFDTAFAKPSIEDIDLGIRIIESGGRIMLVKDALGAHHKDWGVLQLWTTDIFQRAIPWARLIKDKRGRADDLNISRRERASAVAAQLVVPALAAAAWNWNWWPAPAIAIGGYLALNANFLAFLYKRGGARLAVAGSFLHWCYHIYASATFLLVATGLLSQSARSKMIIASTGRTQATRP